MGCGLPRNARLLVLGAAVVCLCCSTTRTDAYVAAGDAPLRRVFEMLPCGSLLWAPSAGIALRRWSAQPERVVLDELAELGVETAVLIRIEELTPQLMLTLSLPFLWSGMNEADFRIRVVELRRQKVLLDARVKRATGGPFQLRPASWSEPELERALEAAVR